MGKGSRAAAARRGRSLVAPPRRRVARNSALAVGAAVLLAALVIGAAARAGDGGSARAPVPRGLVAGGVAEGRLDAPVEIIVYEDLQCPACRAFEQTTGPALDRLVSEGTARVVRRPLAFLDRASTDRYSSRAMNAVGCVADSSAEAAGGFVESLFEQQPAEGGPGLPDGRLVELAEAAGAGDVGSCVRDGRFAGWVRQATEAALETVDSTPTVVVDGTQLRDASPSALLAAVEAAR